MFLYSVFYSPLSLSLSLSLSKKRQFRKEENNANLDVNALMVTHLTKFNVSFNTQFFVIYNSLTLIAFKKMFLKYISKSL